MLRFADEWVFKYNKNRRVNAILLMLLLIKLIDAVNALQCYTCSYTDSQIDDTCLLNPETIGRITNCTKKYCTIVRQEAVSPVGKVISFIRDCQDKPLFLNAVKTDPTFKTYYRSCTTDLCNDSDGTHSATNNDPNFGASENAIIKGKNLGSIARSVSIIILFNCVTISILHKYFYL